MKHKTFEKNPMKISAGRKPEGKVYTNIHFIHILLRSRSHSTTTMQSIHLSLCQGSTYTLYLCTYVYTCIPTLALSTDMERNIYEHTCFPYHMQRYKKGISVQNEKESKKKAFLLSLYSRVWSSYTFIMHTYIYISLGLQKNLTHPAWASTIYISQLPLSSRKKKRRLEYSLGLDVYVYKRKSERKNLLFPNKKFKEYTKSDKDRKGQSSFHKNLLLFLS